MEFTVILVERMSYANCLLRRPATIKAITARSAAIAFSFSEGTAICLGRDLRTPTRAPAGKRLSQLIATACSSEEIPEVSLDTERGAVQHVLALVSARLNQSIIAWLLSFVSSP